MRNRVVIIIVILAIAAVGCLLPRIVHTANGPSSSHTNRRQQTRRTTSPGQSKTRRLPARDYSKFSHRSDKHKSLACDACHMAPTANWLTASAFPDVADYPDHETCTRCHRTQFFKGAKPVICSVCHTKVSPRGKERFEFEKPNLLTQFSTVFPHDKHQDVIATIKFGATKESAHAIFRKKSAQEKTRPDYNNCTICHKTEPGKLDPAAGFQDSFQPPAGTFKTSPVGHSSCFNCHWKNQEPTQKHCAGCHALSQTDVASLPVPKRLSLKFTHTREQHEGECTVCHINITRVSSLSGLKPDVPITSCSESSCHGPRPKSTVVTIDVEVEQRMRDAKFVCVKCHTSDVGKLATPASHLAILQN